MLTRIRGPTDRRPAFLNWAPTFDVPSAPINTSSLCRDGRYAKGHGFNRQVRNGSDPVIAAMSANVRSS